MEPRISSSGHSSSAAEEQERVLHCPNPLLHSVSTNRVHWCLCPRVPSSFLLSRINLIESLLQSAPTHSPVQETLRHPLIAVTGGHWGRKRTSSSGGIKESLCPPPLLLIPANPQPLRTIRHCPRRVLEGGQDTHAPGPQQSLHIDRSWRSNSFVVKFILLHLIFPLLLLLLLGRNNAIHSGGCGGA